MSRSDKRREASASAPVVPEEATEATRETEPPAPPPTAKPSGFVVAKGRAVTSMRGVLDSGTVVTERDFGGEESLAALVAAGIVESAK